MTRASKNQPPLSRPYAQVLRHASVLMLQRQMLVTRLRTNNDGDTTLRGHSGGIKWKSLRQLSSFCIVFPMELDGVLACVRSCNCYCSMISAINIALLIWSLIEYQYWLSAASILSYLILVVPEVSIPVWHYQWLQCKPSATHLWGCPWKRWLDHINSKRQWTGDKLH